MSAFRLEFTTPLFSRGAYEDRPEVRPASIRGQLHWWFRALGGGAQDEKTIFGGVHGGAVASRVVVRVQHAPLHGEWIPTLPHKPPGRTPQDGRNAPRIGVREGLSVDLHILTRLGGLDGRLQPVFDRTLEAWLLLGSLGLRTTRGAGSFKWHPLAGTALVPPSSFEAHEARCGELLRGAPLRFALLGESYATAEAARRVVSDTLGGVQQTADWPSLDELRWPLGNVSTGDQRRAQPGAPKRKTSPLRFRIVTLGGRSRIAALWDARERVTGNRPSDLDGVIRLLAKRKPDLGRQLEGSALLHSST